MYFVHLAPSVQIAYVSTLRKWYSTIIGLPGFYSGSFKAIFMNVVKMKNVENHYLVVWLLM